MEITVRHSFTNPANNYSVECEDMNEAKSEMSRMSSDENGSCSDLLRDGVVIATRDWSVSEITWF